MKTFEKFQAELKEILPEDFMSWVHEDGGEILIHTRLKLDVDNGIIMVVPLVELPDNVIELNKHPKFLAAHYDDDLEDLDPTFLE